MEPARGEQMTGGNHHVLTGAIASPFGRGGMHVCRAQLISLHRTNDRSFGPGSVMSASALCQRKCRIEIMAQRDHAFPFFGYRSDP